MKRQNVTFWFNKWSQMKIVDSKRDSGSIRSKRGIAVTQTTLSRDLRDLGLVKVKRKDQLYYILPNEPEVAEIYIMLSSHAKSVSRAEFTLVLRTELEKQRSWPMV